MKVFEHAKSLGGVTAMLITLKYCDANSMIIIPLCAFRMNE